MSPKLSVAGNLL